ncbi:Rab GTPase [Ordospora colligata]|uniref:Rab GTPase n=1 Tax=Ordospora colligata OC4 TaxID=1354746 RepID=A0A0B2UM37_9MICR|nr:Rab GTPase [Ordospora colligata OC4]KHN70045.1 Rab GTPase [Ordospora colligata OC4]TBU16427.1 Rab GTPase [Ordospora colligata]TBU16612.1 Rab GTPase [Ordospora colligata]TBU19185.1 Rab GTPase [Ordospora colligata]
MEEDFECKYLFKIILIGNSGVGKTCLMKRYADETYSFTQSSTIGVDFKVKTVVVDDEKVKLQIWDTAGQERFRAIISNYYRGANGIIIVFDMGSKESFENLGDWIREVKKNTTGNVEIIVLGNKVDDKERIVITEDEVDEFLKTHGIDKNAFYMTSAKDNICVNDSFDFLTRKLVEKYKKIGFTTTKGSSKFTVGEPKNTCCM